MLESHGQSHLQLGHRDLLPKPPVGPSRHQDRHSFQDIDQAHQGGQPLGQHGRKGRASDPKVQDGDQEQIQKYVQYRRQDQEKQGRPAVPHRPEVGGKQVIEEGGGEPGEDDGDVGFGLRENIRRGPHQPQGPFRSKQAPRRQRRRQDQSQYHAAGHGGLQPVLPPRPEGLAGEDRKADGGAHGKTRHHEHQVPGGAHRRQSGSPQELPYDHGIHHVIQLLKDVPDQDRDHESDHPGQDRPPGHIQLHGISSLKKNPAEDSILSQIIVHQSTLACKDRNRVSCRKLSADSSPLTRRSA